jgi:hypothetical protein
MQWMSLFLVLGFGTATLITDDPRFVMVKPSLIYVIVGLVMLRPGWMNRYLSSGAMAVVPDIPFIFGFVWAGLMLFSATLNVVIALNFSVVAWSAFMTGLHHRQQGRLVPDPILHHALHRRPPPCSIGLSTQWSCAIFYKPPDAWSYKGRHHMQVPSFGPTGRRISYRNLFFLRRHVDGDHRGDARQPRPL